MEKYVVEVFVKWGSVLDFVVEAARPVKYDRFHVAEGGSRVCVGHQVAFEVHWVT
jgi:hypothetical protein